MKATEAELKWSSQYGKAIGAVSAFLAYDAIWAMRHHHDGDDIGSDPP